KPDLRNVTNPRQLILRKLAVENLSILKLNVLEQRTANRLHHRAFNLIVQMQLIHDRTTLETLNHSLDLHTPGLRINRNFRGSRDVTPFLKSTRDPNAASFSLFASPPKRLCRRLQHRFQTLVFDVLQTKLNRVHIYQLRLLIHVYFASE